MSFEHYLRSGTNLMRCGYTTGSCAALAAEGAAELLLSGKTPKSLRLMTPKGLSVETEPEYCRMDGETAVCAIRKDAGDDPDVTDGILIEARVGKAESGILIDGGKGIGRVTKPGLDQPVGAAAINSVPRRMIQRALEDVCQELEYQGGLEILLTVPDGEALAMKTFNPLLGIEGGISILGTSGVVEPMSERAIVDTIALEIHQVAVSGSRRLILAPGNYGLDFLREMLPELERIPKVKCSNFIGDALDLAAVEGMEEVLLVGHIGKLVKLAGGVMNTHSRMADCRREIFCAHAALCGAGQEVCQKLMSQVTTDGCLDVLTSAQMQDKVMESLLAEIQQVLEHRSADAYSVGAVLFSNVHGLLGRTSGAKTLIDAWRSAG